MVGSLDIFGDVARLLQVWGCGCVRTPWAGEGHGRLAPTRLQMLYVRVTQISSVPAIRCMLHYETVLLDVGRCAGDRDQGARHQAVARRDATPTRQPFDSALFLYRFRYNGACAFRAVLPHQALGVAVWHLLSRPCRWRGPCVGTPSSSRQGCWAAWQHGAWDRDARPYQGLPCVGLSAVARGRLNTTHHHRVACCITRGAPGTA